MDTTASTARGPRLCLAEREAIGAVAADQTRPGGKTFLTASDPIAVLCDTRKSDHNECGYISAIGIAAQSPMVYE